MKILRDQTLHEKLNWINFPLWKTFKLEINSEPWTSKQKLMTMLKKDLVGKLYVERKRKKRRIYRNSQYRGLHQINERRIDMERLTYTAQICTKTNRRMNSNPVNMYYTMGHKACLDFEIQTNHPLLTGRPDLVSVKSKKKIRVFISFYIYDVVCRNKRDSFSYMFSFSCLLLPAPVFCGTLKWLSYEALLGHWNVSKESGKESRGTGN